MGLRGQSFRIFYFYISFASSLAAKMMLYETLVYFIFQKILNYDRGVSGLQGYAAISIAMITMRCKLQFEVRLIIKRDLLLLHFTCAKSGMHI